MPTSQAIALLASNSIFLGLAIIAVIVRFISRDRTVPGLGADDWLILVALISAIGLCLTNIIGVPVGRLGQDATYFTEPESEIFLKFSFAWQFFYLFAVAFVKLSILQFYGRIFRHPAFLLTKQILNWIIIGWLVAFFWATLFQVLPVYCNWVECAMTSNYPVMYICSSATDIAIDCAILIMPLTMLRHLEMSRHKKTALTFIFGLGIFCIVASIARLAYTIKFRSALLGTGSADFLANLGDNAISIVMWSGIEACASIICACLPIFGHYLTKIPAVNRYAFKQTTIQAQSPVAVSDARFTGGGREISRGRRLRMSGLSQIDTKVGIVGASPRGRRGTDGTGSSAEFMIATLPSPLMTPKVKGNPTHRHEHEPEIEMGKIHLRTGSEESVTAGRKEVV